MAKVTSDEYNQETEILEQLTKKRWKWNIFAVPPKVSPPDGFPAELASPGVMISLDDAVKAQTAFENITTENSESKK